MDLPADWRSKPAAELEAWFLGALAAEPLPTDTMLELLSSYAAAGAAGRSDAWAELMQETLIERADRDGALRLLAARCRWRAEDAVWRGACEQAAAAVFKDRLGQALVKSAGFDAAAIPTQECVRRLQTLAALRPGALCHDRTWGFGVVKQVDEFYLRVTINFAQKPEHGMSLAYAGETLELVSDDHLLARKHRSPERLAELVRTDPGEVVRIALRSYGPISAVRLKEVLAPEIMPEAEWKPFWDAARRQLKADALVDLPRGRSDPIRLLQRQKAFDGAWFAALAAEKDPKAILDRVETLRREGDVAGLGEEHRRVLGERLAYAMWVTRDGQPDLAVRLILAATAAGVERLTDGPAATPDPAADADAAARERRRVRPATVSAAADAMLAEGKFIAAIQALPVRETQRFLRLLAERHPEETVRALLASLEGLPSAALSPVVEFLTAQGREADCVDLFAAALRERRAGGELFYWLCTNPDRLAGWKGIDLAGVVLYMVDAMDVIRPNERRKITNQLCELFADRPWLTRVVAEMDADERVTLLARLHDSPSWPEAGKRDAQAAIIHLYPELGAVLTALEEARQRPAAKEVKFTSWRTYRERQRQLRELVEKTIPENSREIGHARSYGDLSENFEYQAAKDQQRLLMQRQQELERDLVAVKATDFAGMPTDAAGPGTCATIQRPDGRAERYCILGEWDRDETLGIIASGSRIAEALRGRRTGDEVRLPAAAGEEPCRLVAVAGLDEDVRAWIAGGA